MKYKTIIFDFDGVLCQDRFFAKTLLPDQKDLYDKIQEIVFGDKELVRNWCRNQVTSQDIVRIIVDKTGLDFDLVEDYLYESVKLMELVPEMIELAKEFKQAGAKVAVVTDNMDVFSEITIDNHNLRNIFDAIVNSADYGLVKGDQEGEIFNIASEILGAEIEGSLLIDDSEKTIKSYESKGGQGFLYKNNFEELKEFLAE